MLPNSLERIVAEQMHRIEELERKLENRTRTGTVHEVDAAKGLARVKIDEDKDGKPVLSPWIAWKEPAMGAIKTHFPPEVGEQVKITSESGDITDAVIDYSLPSNANARPHDKGREGVITIGDTRIHFTGDVVNIKSARINLNP